MLTRDEFETKHCARVSKQGASAHLGSHVPQFDAVIESRGGELVRREAFECLDGLGVTDEREKRIEFE